MAFIKRVGLPILFGTGIYYIYNSHKCQTFCNDKCFWTRTNDQVRQILDNSQETNFLHNYSKLFQNDNSTSNSDVANKTNNEQLLLVLNKTELFKDIWNHQIYKLWNWLQSS